MPEVSEYAAGTPSWVDLGTPDIEASASFYGGLFGWDVPESENAEQTGGYRQAMLGGKPVAGMMPLMQEGQPPAWATYVAVDDADATAAKVKDAGGQVMAEPMDVMDLGRMAIFVDPGGAVFGIWQAGSFQGAGIRGEAGAIGWNELNTRDPDRAKEFYGSVFGWGHADEESPRVGTYSVWKVGEAMVGGMLDIDAAGIPAEVPPHWLVYFMVEDTDAAVETVKSGGGDVRMEPIDIPVGRFAVVADPFGAVFAVMQPSAETLANTP
jgi:predicted enzyme related to lactoylglutathione lyase